MRAERDGCDAVSRVPALPAEECGAAREMCVTLCFVAGAAREVIEKNTEPQTTIRRQHTRRKKFSTDAPVASLPRCIIPFWPDDPR